MEYWIKTGDLYNEIKIIKKILFHDWEQSLCQALF